MAAVAAVAGLSTWFGARAYWDSLHETVYVTADSSLMRAGDVVELTFDGRQYEISNRGRAFNIVPGSYVYSVKVGRDVFVADSQFDVVTEGKNHLFTASRSGSSISQTIEDNGSDSSDIPGLRDTPSRTTGAWVDLMPHIQHTAQTRLDGWEDFQIAGGQRGCRVTGEGEKWIDADLILPDSYDVAVRMKAINHPDYLSLSLPIGPSYFAFVAFTNGRCAIKGIDGEWAANSSVQSVADALDISEALDVHLRVIRDGDQTEITAVHEGKQLFIWKGATSRLSLGPGWTATKPGTARLGVGHRKGDGSVAGGRFLALRYRRIENGSSSQTPGTPMATTPVVKKGRPTTLSTPKVVLPRRLYVNQANKKEGDGKSWNTAFADLQEAMKLALSHPEVKEVWIAEGSYRLPSGDHGRACTLRAGLEIYGGFRGVEATTGQRRLASNPTIISGDIEGNDKTSISTRKGFKASGREDNTNTLWRADAASSGSLKIDGITFKGAGQGLVVIGVPRVEVANCRFEEHVHDGTAAGLYLRSTTGVVRNCTFKLNMARTGAGMMLSNVRNLDVRDCEFREGYGIDDAGAVCVNYSSAHFRRCRFMNNMANDDGGAVTIRKYLSWSKAKGSAPPVVFDDCRFEYNSANSGGAFVLNTDQSVEFYRCSLFSNYSFAKDDQKNRTRGGGAMLLGGQHALLVNCNISGNGTDNRGGAICAVWGATELRNCNLGANGSSRARGHEVFCDDRARVTIYNSLVMGYPKVPGPQRINPLIATKDKIKLEGSLVTGKWPGTSFVRADSIKFEDHLAFYQRTLPDLQNKGNSFLVPRDKADLDEDGNTTEPVPLDYLGNPRLRGSSVDIGAFETP